MALKSKSHTLKKKKKMNKHNFKWGKVSFPSDSDDQWVLFFFFKFTEFWETTFGAHEKRGL